MAAVTRGIYLTCLLLGLALAAGAGAVSGQAEAQETKVVHYLQIEGVINPITAGYLERGINRGAEEGVNAVVVRLDTPGGLESSTRDMTRAMLASPVPVVVYVAPAGARAASAGMFITIAAHVAAMAPGTNLGAAHPVGVGGEVDPVMAEKLVSDAAALARSIANTRGRNAEWAEAAVRESVSATAEEAVELNVIDLTAESLDELLLAIDGREVDTVVGPVTLRTAAAEVVDRPMNLAERVLQAIADPNVAYILFTIGVIGLIAELYNPGALFPGITGVIALILAFFAFGSLPINWAGLLLIGLAIVLLVVELNTEGIGILAVGAIVAFVLGSLLLYTPFTPTSPAMPDVRVSPWLIAVITVSFVAFFLVVLRALLRSREMPVVTGLEGLVGSHGQAVSDLEPAGTVRVNSELWSAVAEGAPVRRGEEVVVVKVQGATLRVRRA